ncbi:unnamed protein product [Cochlearia groenlandica]
MRCYQYLPPLKFAYDDNKEAEEQRKEKEKEKKKKEERRMKRIFELVPRKKRSQLRPTQHSPDLSNTKSKNITVYTNTATPKWLLRLMKDMNTTTTTEDDPILVTQKPLDLNDVDPIQNNLTIPFSSLLRNDFLTFQECQITENIHNDETMGVGAIIVDQRTKQWTVVLKKRVVKGDSWVSSRSYLLGGEWSDIVKANSLRDDDNISLWSFRRRGILFFALDFAGDAVDFFE